MKKTGHRFAFSVLMVLGFAFCLSLGALFIGGLSGCSKKYPAAPVSNTQNLKQAASDVGDCREQWSCSDAQGGHTYEYPCGCRGYNSNCPIVMLPTPGCVAVELTPTPTWTLEPTETPIRTFDTATPIETPSMTYDTGTPTETPIGTKNTATPTETPTVSATPELVSVVAVEVFAGSELGGVEGGADSYITYRVVSPPNGILIKAEFSAPGVRRIADSVKGSFQFGFIQRNLKKGDNDILLTAENLKEPVKVVASRVDCNAPHHDTYDAIFVTRVPYETKKASGMMLKLVNVTTVERYERFIYSVPLVNGSRSLLVGDFFASFYSPKAETASEIKFVGGIHYYEVFGSKYYEKSLSVDERPGIYASEGLRSCCVLTDEYLFSQVPYNFSAIEVKSIGFFDPGGIVVSVPSLVNNWTLKIPMME